jgi:hypothetical protein
MVHNAPKQKSTQKLSVGSTTTNFRHSPHNPQADQRNILDILIHMMLLSVYSTSFHSYLQYPSNMHLCDHFRSEEEGNNKITAECHVLQRWMLLKCLGCVQTDRQQAYQCAESHETAHPQLEYYSASSQKRQIK